MVAAQTMIAGVGFVPGDYDFWALVPAGGSAQLTDDESTTTVPINDGIATGVVHDSATLTVQVGGSTQTKQIGPQTSQPSNENDTTPPAAGTAAAHLRSAIGLAKPYRVSRRFVGEEAV